MTLEQYFKDNAVNNTIDFALRATVRADGTVVFYIHPQGKDGDTLDFKVCENTLEIRLC